jgi:hypothetical protein
MMSGFSAPGGNYLAGLVGEYSENKALATWDGRVNELLASARSDHQAFQAILHGIASIVETNESLHPKLLDFLVLHLRGQGIVPRQPRGRKSSGGVRILAAGAVAALVDGGWRPLRNDESVSVCACDIVAQALAELRLSPITYKGVKAVWLQSPRYSRRG